MGAPVSDIDSNAQKRIGLNSGIVVFLWCCVIALIFLDAPVLSILLVGVVGSYFALRDWNTVRSLARKTIVPVHPDAAVNELIDGRIEGSERRQNNGSGDTL
jgi:hypothetical protein